LIGAIGDAVGMLPGACRIVRDAFGQGGSRSLRANAELQSRRLT
jgi:hypothetical protein